MAETASTMIPLGTKAPDFKLYDTVTGKQLALVDLATDKGTVIMFICNHCPYVKHIQKKLVEVVKHYQNKGIGFIAISSNDIDNYPDDHPDLMRKEAQVHGYTFPYLYDADQSIARAYQAACTPDFYIFDKDLLCVYRGRFDAATPGNGKPINGEELGLALDHLLTGKQALSDQKPSLGCNIKWRRT